jgi:hypothetical protein
VQSSAVGLPTSPEEDIVQENPEEDNPQESPEENNLQENPGEDNLQENPGEASLQENPEEGNLQEKIICGVLFIAHLWPCSFRNVASLLIVGHVAS